MGTDKRRFPRKTVRTDFHGSAEGATGDLQFESADLSAGGTFLVSDLLLEPQEELSLDFTVPGTPRPVHTRSRVAWVRRFPKENELPGMGIEFVEMSSRDREALSSYLSAP